MITHLHMQQFEAEGFLCIEGVLSAQDMAPIRQEYEQLLDTLAEGYGMADSTWQKLGFDARYARLIQRHPEAYEHLDISLPLSHELAADAGINAGPAVFSLLSHHALLDIAETFVGPEVYSSPVQHVRMKPPERMLGEVARGSSNMARTNWHQDAAVVLESADNTPILTVWVAMTDATIERGCMEALRGSHQLTKLAMHCPGKTGVGEIGIPEELASQYERVPLEVKAGGIVLLHQKTWHGAGPNTSDHLRWSFDLRYQPAGMSTGRDFFPGFLARSASKPQAVLKDAALWRQSWLRAREEISSGITTAKFNTRWEAYRNHQLCA